MKKKRGRQKKSGVLSGIKPRSQTWSDIRNTIIYGSTEWQMIVLQELASAPKVTLQDQDLQILRRANVEFQTQPLGVHFDKNLREAFCHRHSTGDKMCWLLFGQVSRLYHERQEQVN